MKTCSMCNETKPLEDFYDKKSRSKLGGLIKTADCKQCCRSRSLGYYENHREAVRLYQAGYVKKNRAEISRRALEKYHTDPAHNLRTRVMARISETVTAKNTRRNRWLDILGYSVGELKSHLEKHFLPGMSFDNYGEWHIDHVIPVSAFNYSGVDDIDFKRCWSLSNLRPSWALDNMRKSARISKPFQPSLQMAV